MSALPPPLPPAARDLDLVLGMTAQRVVFHYGIELEGLKYNGLSWESCAGVWALV